MIQPVALSLLALTQSGDVEPVSNFSYTYADLSYVVTDVDGVSEDFEGLDFEGSYEIGWDLRLWTGYRQATLDGPGGDVDADTIEVGVGYHNTANERTDVVLDLAYIDVETDGAGSGNDGYRVAVDFRFQVYDNFEFDAGVAWVDIAGNDGAWYEFEGIYTFGDHIGLTAGYDILDGADQFTLGVRLQASPTVSMF